MYQMNMTIAKAKKYLQSEAYTSMADRSYNIYFSKPITTGKRGRSITRIEFQDYMCGKDDPKYAYCRVFVRLKDGTLLEYKRSNRVTDNQIGLEVFETVISSLEMNPVYWYSFTDIS